MASNAETAPGGPPAVPTRPSWHARTRELRFAALLLIPSVIVVFGIVIYPILRTLYTSFHAVNSPFPGTYPFVGFDNYTHALGNPDFWAAVRRTAYFTVVSTLAISRSRVSSSTASGTCPSATSASRRTDGCFSS